MEEDEDVVDLVRAEVDFLQDVVDVFGRQVPLLAPFCDQLAHFIDGELGRFARLAIVSQVGQ